MKYFLNILDRKRLKGVAEFDFVDGGVYVAPGDESGLVGEEGRAGGRGWWFSRSDKYFRATHYSDFVEGFQVGRVWGMGRLKGQVGRVWGWGK